MKIISVKATNFLSFKNLDYSIEQGVATLIQGINNTEDDQESNGSGKSNLGHCIEYCIMHLTSSKKSDMELITTGESESDMSLMIECPVRKEKLLIERRLARKGGGQSQLSINGEIKYAFVDKMVNEIDKFIIDWVGISKEDIQNYYLVSKFKYQSFFSSSNTALIGLIGRFSNSNIINGIDKDILAEAEKLELQKVTYSTEKTKLIGKLEVYEENLNSELTIDIGELKSKEISGLELTIENKLSVTIHLQTEIAKGQESLGENNNILKEWDESLQKANESLQTFKSKDFTVQYEVINQKIQSIKADETSLLNGQHLLKANEKTTASILHEIELNLQQKVVCPKCKFEFIVGQPDIDIESEKEALLETKDILNSLANKTKEIEKGLEEIEIKLKTVSKEKSAIEAEEAQIEIQKRTIRKRVSEINDKIAEISNENSRIENRNKNYRESIKQLGDDIKNLNEEIRKITDSEYDNSDKVKAIRELIGETNLAIKNLEENESKINDEIFYFKNWAFTFKEFMQYISTKTLKIIQAHANQILEDLRSDLRIVLDGYKMKGDGTLSDKITALVVRDGEEHSFNYYSGGERARLEAAMIRTIQEIINDSHAFGGLDFLLIDEVLESADSKGINSLMKALQYLDSTIYVTTHVALTSFDYNILQVVKDKKVSHLILSNGEN